MLAPRLKLIAPKRKKQREYTKWRQEYFSLSICSVEDATGVPRATETAGTGEDGRSAEGEDSTETGQRRTGPTAHPRGCGSRRSEPGRATADAEEGQAGRSAQRSAQSSTRTARAHPEEHPSY